MEAFEIFNEEAGGAVYYLSVAAGDAAIAQDELVVGLTANGERERVQGDSGWIPGGVDDGEFQGQRTIVGERPLLCGGCFFFLVFAARLAVRAVAADFRPHDGDGETERIFDFLAHAGERFAKVFFDFAAIQADDVRMFALHLGFVVVLVAVLVEQVEFVDEAGLLEHFEGAVDGDAIQLRIFLAGEVVQGFGIEVIAAAIDEVEQDLTLPGEAYALFLECLRSFHTVLWRAVLTLFSHYGRACRIA